MYFKQMLDERCGCASYLIASRQTAEAAVVDDGPFVPGELRAVVVLFVEHDHASTVVDSGADVNYG